MNPKAPRHLRRFVAAVTLAASGSSRRATHIDLRALRIPSLLKSIIRYGRGIAHAKEH
jgi:hypothetical protein